MRFGTRSPSSLKLPGRPGSAVGAGRARVFPPWIPNLLWACGVSPREVIVQNIIRIYPWESCSFSRPLRRAPCSEALNQLHRAQRWGCSLIQARFPLLWQWRRWSSWNKQTLLSFGCLDAPLPAGHHPLPHRQVHVLHGAVEYFFRCHHIWATLLVTIWCCLFRAGSSSFQQLLGDVIRFHGLRAAPGTSCALLPAHSFHWPQAAQQHILQARADRQLWPSAEDLCVMLVVPVLPVSPLCCWWCGVPRAAGRCTRRQRFQRTAGFCRLCGGIPNIGMLGRQNQSLKTCFRSRLARHRCRRPFQLAIAAGRKSTHD
mmetsp:Transcript_48459/g.98670  ORF Transcript_48459/g.98670 Transcript_48459/m.98670 type:complete len:315 (+) Transcript_48459:179-1123(+)